MQVTVGGKRYVHFLMPCETVTIADRIVVVTYADATTARRTSKRLPKIGTYRDRISSKEDRKSGFNQGIHGLSSGEMRVAGHHVGDGLAVILVA